jgi:hypothetical protein
MNLTKPILLVTEQSQDASGGGAVIINSLVKECFGVSIAWASTNSHLESESNGFYRLMSGAAGSKRYSPFDDSTRFRKPLAAEILRLASDIDAAGIWFILHGGITRIAAEVMRRSAIPVHSTVHDDPPYATALRSFRLLGLIPFYRRDLRFILERSNSIDVVCKGMSDYYLRKYGVKSTVVHRALDAPVQPSAKYAALHDQGLRIGVLGNTYGHRQLSVLARAMVETSALIGKPSSLVVCGQSYGTKLQQEFGRNLDVQVTGHVSEHDGVERLRECTAVYLNYPFDWRSKVLRETSFPTKLSTYVYAARPLILHCAEKSSILDLKSINSYTHHWNSMNVKHGAKLLHSLWSDRDITRSFDLEAEMARVRYFDADINRKRMLAQLSNLDREKARPDSKTSAFSFDRKIDTSIIGH